MNLKKRISHVEQLHSCRQESIIVIRFILNSSKSVDGATYQYQGTTYRIDGNDQTILEEEVSKHIERHVEVNTAQRIIVHFT